ncbi:MAG: DUF2071 domain-containing protein [Verrucomicrobiales bacterium]
MEDLFNMKLTMQGRLSECCLLSFRVPQGQVRHILPPGLNLATRGDWAFWNVVLCTVEKMRPLAFPRGAGFTYNHVAYRLMVECELRNHSRLQGLYFARSDADDRLMATMGNCMTDFRFHQSSILLCRAKEGETFEGEVISQDGKAGLQLKAKIAVNHDAPPPSPIFKSPTERREFLKYQPVGLSVASDGTEAHLAEVMRDENDWVEKELQITHFTSQFLAPYDIQLEQAIQIAPLDYRWKLGRVLPLHKATHPKRLSRSMEEAWTL